MSTNNKLAERCDAVVMLTWSNWHTESRSNRYHYATRFARHVPVIFVQPDLVEPSYSFEDSGVENITILHIHRNYTPEQSGLLNRALLERRIIQPLLWVYNSYFADYVAAKHAPFKVYHATEDYFSPDNAKYGIPEEGVAALKRLLPCVDLLVAVSEGVRESYCSRGGYKGRSVTLLNGCDYGFWAASAPEERPADGKRPVALFQGRVNSRLDWPLLDRLAVELPDWDLWLCGETGQGAESHLKELCRHPNVKYWGYVSVEKIRDLARSSTVGIIPFVPQEIITERSLPLKAFEYAACGLPVVSVPIKSLRQWPEVFTLAETPESFIQAVRAASAERYDRAKLARRLAAAKSRDYDANIDALLEEIEKCIAARQPDLRAKNVLILYDRYSVHVKTTQEHLECFAKYSSNNIFYATATHNVPCEVDLSIFDCIVFHYSVRLSLDWHLSKSYAQAIREFGGYKVLFIQDEYEATEMARSWIESLGIHLVHTCVPENYLDKVYPRERFAKVVFKQTLTGFVPEELEHHRPKPRNERSRLIGYRGRALPFYLGDLGQEKLVIGQKMRALCEERGIKVDIEWQDEKRIYGDGWYEFLNDCHATLGTESGANIFDYDGKLKLAVERAVKENPDATYEEIRETYLKGLEGEVMMNQVSPKIFEAIALGAALILFEGRYSDVVQPDRHFIPLKKDFSNIDEVLGKLQDESYLLELTECARREVIESGMFSYKNFVADFDVELAARTTRRSQRKLISSLVAVEAQGQESCRHSAYTSGKLPPSLSHLTTLPLGNEQFAFLESHAESGQLGGQITPTLQAGLRLSRSVATTLATGDTDLVLSRTRVKVTTWLGPHPRVYRSLRVVYRLLVRGDKNHT